MGEIIPGNRRSDLAADMFESAVRSRGDLAGFFEYEDNTGYFYLYEVHGEDRGKVLEHIHILSGPAPFEERDVAIGWNKSENRVGLFIHGELWAVFDTVTNKKFGGNYDPDGRPATPTR